jgi:hypothetical protein
MIDIASRAEDGVRIPGRKATRIEIIDTFKRQMAHLKEKLNVCSFNFFSASYANIARTL